MLGAATAVQHNITLAWLYKLNPHDSTAVVWQLESETAFRLAVQEVNANPSILPQTHIDMVFLDSGATQVKALESLAGALPLGDSAASEDHDSPIVSIIGTGYSAAARAPAMYASIAEVPMISPGSAWAGLADKTEMPYFFRALSPDSDMLAALAEFAAASGWVNVATILDIVGAIEDEANYQAFAEAAERKGINIRLQLTFDGTRNVATEEDVEPTLQKLKESGCKVFVAYIRGANMNPVAAVARRLGLFEEDYVWLTTEALWEADQFFGPSVIYTTTRTEQAAEDAYTELAIAWGSVTSNQDGAALWDNGDGAPDSWANQSIFRP
eukprot:2641982-Rhodomonas_salina.1